MNSERLPRRAQRNRWAFLGFAAATSMAGALLAATPALTITVGEFELQPRTGGQSVELWIANTGDAPLETRGLNLRIQIGDGTGADGAPGLVSVDAVTGTPWEGRVAAELPVVSEPQYWDLRLFCSLFDENEVTILEADSMTRLAQLNFDTTGWSSGSWSLRLAGMSKALGDPHTGGTDYTTLDGQFAPTVVNGMVSIVPEPTEWGLMGMGPAIAWVLWHRRRIRQAS